MTTGESLELITAALQAVGGYFTFTSNGQEYVIASKKDFEQLGSASSDAQLNLRLKEREYEQPVSSDQVLDKINNDIANWQMAQQEVELQESFASEDDLAIARPMGKKISFEPLKGDLSPDLQD